MKFTKKNMNAYGNFILGRYARLTGTTDCRALPVYLFADPSSVCNLRCAMCVDDEEGSGRKRPPAIMKPDVFESLVQDVGETLFMISLYNWGEPLLNRELPRFIARAKEFDIHVDINTNLSLKLHDSDLEELLLARPDNIVVSLDGFSPESYGTYRRGGDFHLVKDNLVRLAALRDRLGLATEIAWKYLVFSFNEHEVEQAERFCAASGITFSRKEAIIDVEKRPEWLPSYRRDEIGQKHGGWPFKRRSDPSLARAGMAETCIWHYSMAAVNSDASLSPCCAVAEKAHDFGAIVPGKSGFGENWNNGSYRAARSILAGRGEEREAPGGSICRNCPFPFLKDFSGGLDTQIRRDFAARFPSPDPLLAEAFRLFDAGEEFIAYVGRNYERLSALPAGGRREAPVSAKPAPAGVPAGSGVCAICGREVGFLLKKEGFSLRETFCPACGASRRSRDLAEVVLETCNANLLALKDLAIFEAQASGPLHERLKGLPGYVCAEFLDGVAPGAMGKNGVRCEDLEALSFPDASFDLVITQDVLEHVAAPGAAFREIARVLKPGGWHIFTVPLHEGRMTVTRARREGETVHLLPPVYHGDPLRSSGSLVYTDFGDDLPALLAECGFAAELLPRGVFYGAGEIPRLDSAGELARLDELRRRGEHLKLFLYNSVVVRARRTVPDMPRIERTHPMEHFAPEPHAAASSSPLDAMLDEVLEIVRHEPVSAAGLTKIGESCFRHDLAASAGGFFRAALERDPGSSDAMNNMGVLAFAGGDYGYAETLFIKTLENAPACREARQNLVQLYAKAPHLADRARENGVHCPCCDGYFPAFIAGGPSLRPNACCPRCGSLERHRLLWLYLKERTDLFTAKLSVLHVAPEPFFQERFMKLPNLDYVSADIASPLAMVQMDITDIQFPDDTFDVILCNHVLEHVPDDRLAMRELLRVLKPDGWAILQVPIDAKREQTYEDPAITEPEERLRHFGQDDHVRWYGRDYADRLAEAGFAVSVRDFTGGLSAETIRSCGIVAGEEIYHCRSRAMSAEQQTIAGHWGSIKYVQDKKTRWWQFPAILRHINTMVCGRPVEGFSQGLIELLKEKGRESRYDTGVAVACGSGQKEMNLVIQGIVGRFLLFDLSPERVRQGKELAGKHGIEDRITFLDENPFYFLPPGSIDLVHWNNALHHMLDAGEAVRRSRRLLRSGGVFLMDDYIGPNRFQWTNESIEMATWLRQQLPPHFLRNPGDPLLEMPVQITRPDPDELKRIDPSEAADSENILPAVREEFPDVDIRMTGGVIYHLALNNVLANLDEEKDGELLLMMLDLDEKCSNMGWNHYAAALGFA